jgi:hypothetical protein
MTLHPTYSPTSPYDALGCDLRRHDIRFCAQQYCPHRWQRISAADRARREEEDRREAEGRR